MQFTINLADKLDPLALYAALLSSVIFVWELYKWIRRGPKLTGSVTPNMIMIGGGYKDDNTYLTFNIANVGTEKTTITTIALLGYASWWSWIRKRPTRNAIIMQGLAAYPVPYVLEVGERFMASGFQDDKLEQWSKEHWLYGAIYHSFSRRPLMMRIKPIEKTEYRKAKIKQAAQGGDDD